MIDYPAKLVVLSEQDERFPNERAVLDYFVYHLQWKGRKLRLRKIKVQGATLLYFQYKGYIIAKVKADMGKEKEIEIDRESIMIRKKRMAVCDLRVCISRKGRHSNSILNTPAPRGIHDLDARSRENIDDECFNIELVSNPKPFIREAR